MADVLLKIQIRRNATERSWVQFIDFKDGVRAGLRIRYSAVSSRWWCWLTALDGTTIATLGPLVPGVDLLLGHKHHPECPQGQLFVYSADELKTPPTAETADETALLFYRRVT